MVTTVTNLKAYREAIGFYEMEKLCGGDTGFSQIYEDIVNLDASNSDKEAYEIQGELHSKEAGQDKT